MATSLEGGAKCDPPSNNEMCPVTEFELVKKSRAKYKSSIVAELLKYFFCEIL